MTENNKTDLRPQSPISWYPGHMAKAKRQIKESLNLVDLIFEVIDARIVLSSRINLDDLTNSKDRIIIVSKYDLCDQKRTDELLNKHYSQDEVFKIDLLNDNALKILTKSLKEKEKTLNDKRALKGLKPRCLRALVIGAPNVGKSSFINNLVSKKATKVANTAGVTKALSWIRVNKDLELLDSPGLLIPNLKDEEQALKLAALGIIKEELIPKEKVVKYIYDYLKSNYPQILENRYRINLNDDFYDNLEYIAQNKGYYKKGNLLDSSMVYNLIYNELNKGIIKKISFD